MSFFCDIKVLNMNWDYGKNYPQIKASTCKVAEKSMLVYFGKEARAWVPPVVTTNAEPGIAPELH